MIRSTVRSVFHIAAVLCLMAGLAVSAAAWRLNQGPIALDFLTPIIETALNQGEFSVTLDRTVLALGQDDRLLEIRVQNVNAYRAGMVGPIASVPDMALTLSARALLNGELAPKSVFLYRPRLHLVRDEEDHLFWSMGRDPNVPPTDPAAQKNSVDDILSMMLGDPAPGQPGRHMNRAAIMDAELQVVDLKTGIQWTIPRADLDLVRVMRGLVLRTRLETNLNGQPGALQVYAQYDKASERYGAEAIFSGLRPSSLAPLGGGLAPLQAADMVISGRIAAQGGLKTGLDRVDLDLTAGEGIITLPEPVAFRAKVESVHLRAVADQNLSRVVVEDFSLDAGQGTRVFLTAQAEGLGGDAAIKLQAKAESVTFDRLPELWPGFVAPNAREWVVANLSKGVVHEAHARVDLRIPNSDPNRLIVDHVSGDMQGDGAVVNYLRPMPAVKNASATVTFDANEFRIHVRRGDVYGLSLSGGTIILGGLSAVDQFADIDLSISGPASDALKLIDNKPLRYAQALGIDPHSVGGQASTRLRLKFPLLKNLRLDDVEVKASAKVKDIFLPNVVMGQDVTRGDLDLEVDAKGLDASGPIVLGTIAGDLKWRENFSARATPFRSRYQLQAKSIDDAQRAALGLDGPPFIAPFVSGPVAAVVDVKLFGGGRGEVDAKIDLSPAHMTLPGLGWRKETRTSGKAEILLRLEKLKLDSIPRFDVTAGDLSAKGSVSFDGDGRPRQVDFSRLAYGGRTDLDGSLFLRPNGGLDVTARGKSFNGEPVLAPAEPDPFPAESGMVAGAAKTKKDDLPPMSITLAVDRLWVSSKGYLHESQVHLKRDAKNWHTMSLKALVDQKGQLEIGIHPGPGQGRTVKITSNDAGAVLRAFETYDHMMGGALEVEGRYDDSRDDQPLSGTIRITDYHIVNAPALARLLTVAALTGILDVLRGQGVSFSNLDAPFVLRDGLLKIQSARAWGPALGLTASGEVDLDHSRMALEGTVVPAYVINSMLGNIPVLGWLVTGGEKGGGLVAFNFSMRGSTQEPDVLVNPLSAFTPGFLRNLFNIFDSGTETDTRKPKE